MVLALTRPDLVARLLVADIAPVPYTHSQLEHIVAMRAVDLSAVTRRSDAAQQLAAQGTPPALQSFFTQSLDVPERRWLLNLDALADNMDAIMGFPMIEAQFEKPTLFLSGADSDYVQTAHRPTIKSLFPKARFARIAEAGHWLHADKPREFEATLRAFASA
jgi:pimeloyl-ACP methyl ester carboxylesterase